MVSPFVKQLWVTTSAFLMMIATGMQSGMSSTLNAALESPESRIKTTPAEANWIVSAPPVGGIVVNLITPYIIHKYGRRKGIVLLLLPALISPFIACFIANVKFIILARFLFGCTATATSFVSIIIVAEYSAPEYRGIFLTLRSACTYIGFALLHIAAEFLHWKVVYFVANIPYLLALIIPLTSPESPSWLITQNDYKGCTEAFYRMRGITEATTQELTEMIAAQKQKPYAKRSFIEEVMLYLQKFKKRNFLQPIGMCIVIGTLAEFTGIFTFTSYVMQIVLEMDSDPSHTFYYILSFDLFMTMSSIFSAVLMKIMKNRTLLFSSGISSVIILLILSVYYYLEGKDIVSRDLKLIPLALFALYFLLVNLGCTPISLNLIGEIFPLEHRASATCIAGLILSLIYIGSLQIVSVTMATVKLCGMFGVFGAVMVVCLVILYYTLPETKNKTLQEIENYLEYGSYSGMVSKQEIEKLRDDEKDSKELV